jgi:hypothetical protein
VLFVSISQLRSEDGYALAALAAMIALSRFPPVHSCSKRFSGTGTRTSITRWLSDDRSPCVCPGPCAASELHMIQVIGTSSTGSTGDQVLHYQPVV